MALYLPILSEHQRLISSLLGGDQHLRLKISDEDFISPLLPKEVRRQVSAPYNKSLKRSTTTDAKNFIVNVDVQQFAPEEISVKSINEGTIVVECKHEEKVDEHGSVYRHFIRKYKVPKGHDVSKCISKLSSDGVLTITAPKVKNKKTEIEIPVIVTNQLSHFQHLSKDDKEENSIGSD